MLSLADQDSSSAPLTFTEQAATKTWDFIQEELTLASIRLRLLYMGCPLDPFILMSHILLEEALALKLKVFIKGGGCQGFRYEFDFTTQVKPSDTLITQTITTQPNQTVDVILVVDAVSLHYLRGAKIDYQNDIKGERFIISNLKAKTTCGCGSSFAV